MKLILAQPSILRFRWELEVLLTNVRQFTDMEVVLLFSKHDDTVPRYLVNKYSGVRCFVYNDNRYDKTYIPSIRPYLLWQYLQGHPERENETYFYIDSDVIFREWPKLDELRPTRTQWYGSSCDNYIGYEYIKQCQRGSDIVKRMAQMCGITEQYMARVPGIGAHIVMANPTAAFWQQSYNRSNAMWHYLDGVSSNIQKWTAEMWAQLWTMVEYGITVDAPAELNFCMATDPLTRWEETKIMHNNGVTGSGTMFFKAGYTDHTPFGEDFSYVDTNKCSRKYADAIERVIV